MSMVKTQKKTVEINDLQRYGTVRHGDQDGWQNGKSGLATTVSYGSQIPCL